MLKSLCCCFGRKPDRGSSKMQVHGEDEFFIVEIVSCSDVPKMDFASESDPYVKVRAFRNNVKIGNSALTMHRNDDKNPVYHSFHNLGFRCTGSETIQIKIYDYDPEGSDELISEKTVDASIFDDEKPKVIPMSTDKYNYAATNPFFSVTLRRHFVNQFPPLQKTIFIVRHGESKWNEAQAATNIIGMLNNDHGLSSTGIKQCLKLNQAWKDFKSKHDSLDDEKCVEAKFLRADQIFCSPLTRAVQTALCSLKEHPAILSGGVTLMSCIRERKMTGGLDTVGIAKGPEIRQRVMEQTRTDGGQPLVDQLSDIRINIGDANEKWWSDTTTTDLDAGMELRVNEMLNRAHYGPHKYPVFVGHSIFFHYLYSRLLSLEFYEKKPELAEKMRKYRLSNASVMALEIEWNPHDDKAKIMDAEILFGGGFHIPGKHHDQHHTSSSVSSSSVSASASASSYDEDGKGGPDSDEDEIDCVQNDSETMIANIPPIKLPSVTTSISSKTLASTSKASTTPIKPAFSSISSSSTSSVDSPVKHVQAQSRRIKNKS